MRFGGNVFLDGQRQPRLANACLTRQQDNLAFAAPCSGPASLQDFAFFFTSDEFGRAGRM